MKYVDKVLQNERIKKAYANILPQSRILDIGCNQGELFNYFLSHKMPFSGVGLDPHIEKNVHTNGYELIKDQFPSNQISSGDFDAITLLAVLEHIPINNIPNFASECYRSLKPGGRLIITVPSKAVDRILDILMFLRLIKGMDVDQHYGYDIKQTGPLFEQAGFKLLKHKTFQLGLNNLFIFER